MIKGYASLKDTKSYFENRNINTEKIRKTPWFYTLPMAIGTYLGNTSKEHSNLYIDSIIYGLINGVNYIDTACIYREMESERNIGNALNFVINEKKILKRNEIVISSKAGIIDNDFKLNIAPKEYINNILLKKEKIKREKQIIEDEEVIYSIDTKLHEFSIKNSRKNLGLNTIDVMYIHNPERVKMEIGEKNFFDALKNLIKFYEGEVKKGHIRFYGMATWYAFRVSEDNPMYISLEKVIKLAEEIGGKDHHFRFVQMPYNMKDNTAKTKKTQKVKNEYLSAIDAANKLGLKVTISAPLNQCNDFKTGEFNSKELIKYVVETKGVYAAMIGSKKRENLIKNLGTILD